jgi:glycosyltransferase involved in cell wall biosynthesis
MIDNDINENTLTDAPKVSIIIPVYNVKKYLLRCIRSILGQTYKNYEVILVDDGSTDGSGILCDKLKAKDRRIKVIHKDNGGMSSARNVGIECAKGDYITFVDSDDYISDRYLETLVDLMGERKDRVVLINAIFGKEKNYKFNSEHLGYSIIEGYEFRRTLLYNRFGDSCCGKLIPRDFFEDFRFIEGRVLEDLAITYRLFFRAKEVVISEESLYYYYQREGSVMHSRFSMKHFSGIYSYEERLSFIKKNGERELYERFMQQYVAVGLKYYYKIRRNFPEEVAKAKVLRENINKGYKECWRSKQWNIFARIGGFIGLCLPYLTGKLVNIILK